MLAPQRDLEHPKVGEERRRHRKPLVERSHHVDGLPSRCRRRLGRGPIASRLAAPLRQLGGRGTPVRVEQRRTGSAGLRDGGIELLDRGRSPLQRRRCSAFDWCDERREILQRRRIHTPCTLRHRSGRPAVGRCRLRRWGEGQRQVDPPEWLVLAGPNQRVQVLDGALMRLDLDQHLRRGPLDLVGEPPRELQELPLGRLGGLRHLVITKIEPAQLLHCAIQIDEQHGERRRLGNAVPALRQIRQPTDQAFASRDRLIETRTSIVEARLAHRRLALRAGPFPMQRG